MSTIKEQKQYTLYEMQNALDKLRTVKTLLVEINSTTGEQFDFANNAQLANLTDDLQAVLKQIDKIVYQE